jgi:hypothetical protein
MCDERQPRCHPQERERGRGQPVAVPLARHDGRAEQVLTRLRREAWHARGPRRWAEHELGLRRRRAVFKAPIGLPRGPGHPAVPTRLDRDALDALALDCEAPPGVPVRLSGRCHPGAPSTYRVRPPGRLVAACSACSRLFALLDVDTAGEGGYLRHHPECNPGRDAELVVLSYALGSGEVQVACAGCGEPLGAFPLRRQTP